jgi:hypothetical protein
MKRSGRDESVWVVIYLCMEAMLGISLYSYPYVKLAKTLCLSYYCLCLLFNKIEEGSRYYLEARWEEGTGRKLGREGTDSRREKWPKQCMHI